MIRRRRKRFREHITLDKIIALASVLISAYVGQRSEVGTAHVRQDARTANERVSAFASLEVSRLEECDSLAAQCQALERRLAVLERKSRRVVAAETVVAVPPVKPQSRGFLWHLMNLGKT